MLKYFNQYQYLSAQYDVKEIEYEFRLLIHTVLSNMFIRFSLYQNAPGACKYVVAYSQYELQNSIPCKSTIHIGMALSRKTHILQRH